MKKFKFRLLQLSYFITIAIVISACAKINYSSTSYALVKNHKTLAIVPPLVSVGPYPEDTDTMFYHNQNINSQTIQNELYSWLQTNQSSVDIQDINKTSELLKNAGYPEKQFSKGELNDLLGVDALIKSQFNINYPMSETAAFAFLMAGNNVMPTNAVSTLLSITDCSTDSEIWSYKHSVAGGLGSTPDYLIRQLMKKATKKMPYQNK